MKKNTTYVHAGGSLNLGVFFSARFSRAVFAPTARATVRP